MAVAGVICEWNPFHLGHGALLRRIRTCLGEGTAIVCVMSGNYVQRGVPALFDKFTRARAAVECGASLVLELPLTCAVSSAESFAGGGVAVLDRLGVVDTLCFGSESGDLRAIQNVAEVLCGGAYDAVLRRFLEGGGSYAACRQAAVRTLAGGDADRLSDPNDNLGVEYCKALLRRESAIHPLAFRRPGGYHDERPDSENPSATAVRGLIERGEDWRPYVPEAAAAVFAGAPRYRLEAGERAMLAVLRSLPDEAFAALPGSAEGLGNKLRRACRAQASVAAILSSVKSKRYAHARLRRMLLCAYLGLTAADLQREPPYVRVLAFDGQGRTLLRRAKEKNGIPIVNAGEGEGAYYALECRAADLFTLFAEEACPCGTEKKGRIYYRDSGRQDG